MFHQGVPGFRQDAHQVALGQGLQFHANGKPALQFGYQVGRLGHVKRPGGDKQNMVGLHRAILGIDGRSFDNGQQIPLHAFPGHVGPQVLFPTGDFIDLIQKDDAGLFDPFDGVTRHLIHVNQFLRFFLRQVFQRFGNLHDPVFLFPGHQPAQHVAQVIFEVFHASDVGDNPDRQSAFLDFDFHRPVVEPAFPQLFTELLSRVVG